MSSFFVFPFARGLVSSPSIREKQTSKGCLVLNNSAISYLKDIIKIKKTPLLIFNDFYSFYKKLNKQLKKEKTIIHPKYLVHKNQDKLNYEEYNF